VSAKPVSDMPFLKFPWPRRAGISSYGKLTLRSALLSVGLHGNMSIKVVQCAVGLFTAIPTALVHSLNLFVSSSRSLMLLRTRNGHERVNLTINQISHSSKSGVEEWLQSRN
jgi:hypothetical protein